MTPGVTCSGPDMAAHAHLLRGLALRESVGGGNSNAFMYFSVADLSLDPKVSCIGMLFLIYAELNSHCPDEIRPAVRRQDSVSIGRVGALFGRTLWTGRRPAQIAGGAALATHKMRR